MDLIDRLQEDHQKFRLALFSIDAMILERSRSMSLDDAEKATFALEDIIERLIQSILRHEEIEHDILFPSAISKFPAMESVIEEAVAEHGDAMMALSDLQRAVSLPGQSDDEIAKAFRRFQTQFTAHLAHEERTVFQSIREAIRSDFTPSLTLAGKSGLIPHMWTSWDRRLRDPLSHVSMRQSR